MKVGKIFPYFGQKSNAQNSANKQDLTSFGVENRTQLLSKESATALKNKFMADVSFTGYFRSVYLESKGEYKDIKYDINEYRTVSTSGGSQFVRNVSSGKETYWVSEEIKTLMLGKEGGSYSTTEKQKAGYDFGYSIDNVIRGAIFKSDNYIEGSDIRILRIPKQCMDDIFLEYNDPSLGGSPVGRLENCKKYDPSNVTGRLYAKNYSGAEVRVYFSDPDEKIDKEIIEEAHCVVYAPGAEIKKDEPPIPEPKPEPTPEPKPEPPKKKSLWQRIFG